MLCGAQYKFSKLSTYSCHRHADGNKASKLQRNKGVSRWSFFFFFFCEEGCTFRRTFVIHVGNSTLRMPCFTVNLKDMLINLALVEHYTRHFGKVLSRYLKEFTKRECYFVFLFLIVSQR